MNTAFIADLLAALLVTKGESIVIGSQSYGGMLAQAYLAVKGNAVERLILSSTGPADYNKPVRFVDYTFIALARLLPEVTIKNMLVGGLLKLVTIPEAERAEWENAIRRLMYNSISHADVVSHFAVAADLIRKGIVTPSAYQKWSGDVIVLSAENDPTQSKMNIPHYEKLFGRPVKKVNMGNMGHTALLFDPVNYVVILKRRSLGEIVMTCRLILLLFLTVAIVACSSTDSLPEITANTTLWNESPTPSQPVSTLEPKVPIDISSLTGRIVFTAGPHPQEDIYVINADGSGLTQLTTDPAADYDPSWSPDGARIAFRSKRDGNDEIYIMNVDGSGQTNLTNHLAMDLSPAWSPDGTLIAFASDRDGAGSTLWIMNADGSNPRRIGDTGGEYPAWSPDGKRLAFDYQTFSDSEFDIWVINVDGSGASLLAGGLTSQQGPDWSPDGYQIAFESELEAENNFDHIWLMNADGSGQKRLSQGHGGRPVWSPDGRYILFMAGGIYVMPIDGSEVIQFPVTGLGELAFPDWTE